MAEWELVSVGPVESVCRCTACGMIAHVRTGDGPPEKCSNCGEQNKRFVAGGHIVGKSDYETDCRRLMEDYRKLEKAMDEMKTDLCIAEREREKLQAQMEVVRLIFGGRRDD